MSVLASIRSQLAPIHPEGYPFIGGFALASLILFWLWSPLGWIGTVMTIWCALFFRDPDRVTPTREGLVVAPADGRVTDVTPIPWLEEFQGPAVRIGIYLSIFNLFLSLLRILGIFGASSDD